MKVANANKERSKQGQWKRSVRLSRSVSYTPFRTIFPEPVQGNEVECLRRYLC